MNFADVGGVPFVGAGDGGGYLPAVLAMLGMKDHKRDDGREWSGMMFLFVIFVLVIFVVVALIWSRRDGHHERRDFGGIAEVAAISALGKQHGDYNCHEHWDQVRDTMRAEQKQTELTLQSKYELSRQADHNRFDLAMQAERHNNETNRNIDTLRSDTERQTLLLMREMDAKEASALREKITEERLEKSNLMQTMAIIHALAPKPPVAVNSIWGQVPIHATFPHGGGGCHSAVGVI